MHEHRETDDRAPATNVGIALYRVGFRPSCPLRRTFAVLRHRDHSGVSGTGFVAEGVVFSDGTCALRWLGCDPTTTLFTSIEQLIRIHGHGGATWVQFDDSDEQKGG